MADAKVVFETELDTSGLQNAINSLESNGMTFGLSKSSLDRMGSVIGSTIGKAASLEIQKSILKASFSTGMSFDTAMSQVAATTAEHNALVDEINKAANIEEREQYKRLYEIRAEVKEISKKLNNIKGRCNTAEYALNAAGIPLGIARANYHFILRTGTPASIEHFLKDRTIDYDISVHYKPVS